jgi:hypothetical protein
MRRSSEETRSNAAALAARSSSRCARVCARVFVYLCVYSRVAFGKNANLPPGSLSMRQSGASLSIWRISNVPNLGQGATFLAVGEHPIKSWISICLVVVRVLTFTHPFFTSCRNLRAKLAKRPKKLVSATKIWCKAHSPSAKWRAWRRALAWKKICSLVYRFLNKNAEDKKLRHETSTHSLPLATLATTSQISWSALLSLTKAHASGDSWTQSLKASSRRNAILFQGNKMFRCVIHSGYVHIRANILVQTSHHIEASGVFFSMIFRGQN